MSMINIILALLLAVATLLSIISIIKFKEARTESARLKQQLNSCEVEFRLQKEHYDGQVQRYESLESDNQSLREQLSAERTKLQSTQEAVESLKNSMQDHFRSIATQVMEEKSQKFDQHSEQVLTPLREELQRLQEKVESTYAKSKDDQVNLLAALEQIRKMNDSLQREANNLTMALKGDAKKQGDWGEVILQRVLESSGLEEGREYQTQVSISLEDNKRLRPDVIIYLPDNRHVIVDAKVSLTAYERYVSIENEHDRRQALKGHVSSLKKHVDELAQKDYSHQIEQDALDYVLMFVPIESAFSTAIQQDSQLFDYAWRKGVVMVTPTTLLATLGTINYMWKQVKQTKNALEIAERGGRLYDKVVSFVKDMDELGSSLTKAQQQYEQATQKLSKGKGNVLSQAESLRNLGAKTQKSLADTKLGRALGEV